MKEGELQAEYIFDVIVFRCHSCGEQKKHISMKMDVESGKERRNTRLYELLTILLK